MKQSGEQTFLMDKPESTNSTQSSGLKQPSNNPAVGVPNPASALNPPSFKQEEADNKPQGEKINKSLFGSRVKSFRPSSFFSIKLLKRLSLLVAFLLFLGVLSLIMSRRGQKAPSQAVDRGNEIVWWGLWDEEPINALIAEYQKVNPEVKISYQKQRQETYRKRLTSSFAKGEGPDIFDFHNTWVPMFSANLSLAPSTILSKEQFSKLYYPVIVKDLTKQKGVVGLPLEFDVLVLFINDDIFAAAAESPPETWDEFSRKAAILTQRSVQGQLIQAGAAIGITENVDYWPELVALLMFQNGVNPAKPESPKALEALRYYSGFSPSKGKDSVWDATLPPSTLAFAKGKLAMFFAPSKKAAQIIKENPDLRFRIVSPPQVRQEDPLAPDISYATYWSEGVWNLSRNKEASWRFLKYLSQPELMKKFFDEVSTLDFVGRAYSRIDMAQLLIDDPVLGKTIALAPNAKSWYLADETYDGEDGINSKITTTYQKAVVSSSNKKGAGELLTTLSQEIRTTLSQYGL